jgi:predicted transcriptional regulator
MIPLRTITYKSMKDVLNAAMTEECGDSATYESIRMSVGRTPNRLDEYISLLVRLKMIDNTDGMYRTTENGKRFIEKMDSDKNTN